MYYYYNKALGRLSVPFGIRIFKQTAFLEGGAADSPDKVNSPALFQLMIELLLRGLLKTQRAILSITQLFSPAII